MKTEEEEEEGDFILLIVAVEFVCSTYLSTSSYV